MTLLEAMKIGPCVILEDKEGNMEQPLRVWRWYPDALAEAKRMQSEGIDVHPVLCVDATGIG